MLRPVAAQRHVHAVTAGRRMNGSRRRPCSTACLRVTNVCLNENEMLFKTLCLALHVVRPMLPIPGGMDASRHMAEPVTQTSRPAQVG